MVGLQETQAGRPVALKGDKRLLYGDVKEVMALCNQAGFYTVGLITTKDKE